MNEFSNYLKSALLNHTFRGVLWTPPAKVYMALYLTPCSLDARGDEVVGAGYLRQPMTWGPPSTGRIVSDTDAFFRTDHEDWGNVVSIGIEDAPTGGHQLCFDNDFEDFFIRDGDWLVFEAETHTVEIR